MVGKIVAQDPAPALDADDAYARAPRQGDGGDPLADQRAFLHDDEMRQVSVTFGFVLVERAGRTVGQQLRPQQDEVDQAGGGSDQPDTGNLEHSERRQSLFLRHPVHQQVGRGADQRQRAAKDREVGQRDQQLGGGKTHRLGQPLDDRDHHQRDRRIVHERRCRQRAKADLGHGETRLAARAADDPAGHFFQRSGSQQGSRKHEHRGNRDRGGIGEYAEQFVGREEPQKEHRKPPDRCQHHRRQAFEQEAGKQDDEERQPDLRVEGGERIGQQGWHGWRRLSYNAELRSNFAFPA